MVAISTFEPCECAFSALLPLIVGSKQWFFGVDICSKKRCGNRARSEVFSTVRFGFCTKLAMISALREACFEQVYEGGSIPRATRVRSPDHSNWWLLCCRYRGHWHFQRSNINSHTYFHLLLFSIAAWVSCKHENGKETKEVYSGTLILCSSNSDSTYGYVLLLDRGMVE